MTVRRGSLLCLHLRLRLRWPLPLLAAASFLGAQTPGPLRAQPASGGGPAAPGGGAAVDASPEARREAADRFDRGVTLFNEGDNAGALAEFRRAYALVPQPIILFNMALVYTELKRPVDAMDALERLLAAPGALPEARLDKARELLAQHARDVGALRVVTNLPAVVEVDGVEAGRTPSDRPIRVARGHHVVGVVAEGAPPLRRTVDIAGGETQVLEFALVPTAGTRETVVIERRTAPDPEARGPLVWTGWGTLMVGAVTLGAGGYLVYDALQQRSTARAALDLVLSNARRFGGGSCDPSGAIPQRECEESYRSASEAVRAADGRVRTAWTVFGVGATVAAAGGAILLVARLRADSPAGEVALVPALAPGAGGLRLVGRF